MKVISRKDPSTKVDKQKNLDKELQTKKVDVTKKTNLKIVEAMFERTPESECFRQFAKQYLYFISQSEPIFGHTVTKNFAYSLHMNDVFVK